MQPVSRARDRQPLAPPVGLRQPLVTATARAGGNGHKLLPPEVESNAAECPVRGYKTAVANRYLIDPLPAPGPGVLGGEVAHHLGTVLRARTGDEVRLFDGRGSTCTARIESVDRRAVTVRCEAHAHLPRPSPRVHVAFAVPKLQRAEWLLEHGTELGIDTFHPVATRRARPQGTRPDRWSRLVAAAAGQCDRDWLPELQPLRDLQEFLADPTLPAARFVGEQGAPLLRATGTDAILLVGPEGGFDEDEREAIAAAGFCAASFGRHILRTETAAFTGAALLLHGA